jgi:hypothetical protein
MYDLNTLIPPGSGLTLTTPLNINDRGEIATWAAPVSDTHFRHAILLIPSRKQ